MLKCLGKVLSSDFGGEAKTAHDLEEGIGPGLWRRSDVVHVKVDSGRHDPRQDRNGMPVRDRESVREGRRVVFSRLYRWSTT